MSLFKFVFSCKILIIPKPHRFSDIIDRSQVFTFNIQRFLSIAYVVGGSIEKLLILQKLLDKIHNGSISQKKKKIFSL